ncbi:type VI secretion system baseplate subunit TssF [Tenacibaculum finnmarkense genomovar finnmarkense]|uniref:type VI secretion system baseplate subunit TssF n=1 Tax=Tenacibaculum finnmarkense TaxID=2781243 RepID=UPI00187BBEEC|nr:type VI secretion system baseplate subunit TssF [Tenacibaculum finnmarkense]MBE7661046.1 hypothetical protein [Tenacibaculum finnmarkense genomovar finnmarkense]MCD8418346.1 type VI secretion system baseplate subunit TssF [Tenacibaculum finnmarkense genomovar finnmarkense]MCG8186785.1 type VI secretion system baseplate subunit TssF [Tenacibaculum finnmarkense genomovar finnmarkense]MCG8203299.1 type VI secretion system baseplate subunit TssF [Tenacibaculum finnmarkense genomovar finnmarkense
MMVNDYKKIKERMKMRSMELWGIENTQKVDPVIEMFLDVFSYELSKVHQEVKVSDAKLLERVSKILVNESWSLPTPSHTLLSVHPSEQVSEMEKTTQLYFQKIVKGELNDVFFTPIKNQELLKANVYCTAWDRELSFDTNKGYKHIINSYKESKIPEYTIWVGIDIDESLLKDIKKIPISILLKDSHLDPYIKMSSVQDCDGNDLKLYQEEDLNTNKEHYYATIQKYYQDYLYTVDLSNSSKKRQKLTDKCSEVFNQEDIEEYDKELFWLEISFSVAFTKEELDKITISTNTFPIVNRKKSYKQHSLKRNGKIVSLYFKEKEYFLNAESLIDNEGRVYKNALKNDINNMEGSFSLYFGDIEQFDERNAKYILSDVIQTVREEGSSFSAMGYDLLNSYLEDLNDKLDALERKVNFRFKDVSNNNEKVYLQTIPYKTSDTYECVYWTTNAGLANGIKEGALLSQYQIIDLESDSIRLLTDTVGGAVKKGTKEKISSFRYGLLSKDRIVSNEDIKEFMYVTIGDVVKSVSVKSGVGISVHKKQGLIRTINVEVLLKEAENLSSENKKRLGNSLELQLESKSVHNTPYRVNII